MKCVAYECCAETFSDVRDIGIIEQDGDYRLLRDVKVKKCRECPQWYVSEEELREAEARANIKGEP